MPRRDARGSLPGTRLLPVLVFSWGLSPYLASHESVKIITTSVNVHRTVI